MVLLIVNLQFSEFLLIRESGQSKNGVSTLVGHLLFSGQFQQTKIEDLVTCLEFGKTQTAEVLSKIQPPFQLTVTATTEDLLA